MITLATRVALRQLQLNQSKTFRPDSLLAKTIKQLEKKVCREMTKARKSHR